MRVVFFKRKIINGFLILLLIIISILLLFIIYKHFEKNIYPIIFEDDVLEFSKEYELNPLLIFSIIKVESNFNTKAVSGANAIGLMQITKNTANYISYQLNIIEYDLFDAKTNIKFGCYYLRYLLEKFNNIDTVICAYNAGEGNVIKWLNNKNYSNDKITLNHIPFYETEKYLGRIKKSFDKYRKLYQNILDKFNEN